MAKTKKTKKNCWVARNPQELAIILGLDPSVVKEWEARAKKETALRRKKPLKNMRDILNEIDPTPLTSGRVLKSAGKTFNITQDQICEITGLKKSNLSALENNKIEMTVHYAEILGAALGLHPSSILFPNGHYGKSKEIKQIEKKAAQLLKKVRPI